MLHGPAAYVAQYRPRMAQLKEILEKYILEEILRSRKDYSPKFKIAVIRRQGSAAQNYEICGNPHPISASNQSIIESDIPDFEELLMDEDGGPDDMDIDTNTIDITVREVNLGPVVARVSSEVVQQFAVSDVGNGNS
jgi:hypothetical protein